jgi:hypothetical protein
MVHLVKYINFKIFYLFIFGFSALVNAQTHTEKNTRDKTKISEETPNQEDITWEDVRDSKKHMTTPKAVKEKIKADFLETGELPEGCHLYYGVVTCSGPHGGKPSGIYADISTRHSNSGKGASASDITASFWDSATGRENTRVTEGEIQTAYNEWKIKDPKKAEEWMRRQPAAVEDRINYLNGVPIKTGEDLRVALEKWKEQYPEAAEEWLRKRPHAKKNMKK